MFDVTEYGASGDGESLDTEAIQAAVDDCSDAGGGVVFFPPGDYLTTPIFLRDDVTVYVGNGATLVGSEEIDAYPSVEGRWEGVERETYASMFTGHGLENVTIAGPGTLDGRGEIWWETFLEDTNAYEDGIGRGRPYPGTLDYPRPRMIYLHDCENVTVRDVTIEDSPAWTIHPTYCENVTVDNVTIRNPEHSENTDGINPDSCRNVRISNCHIDVGDDCITLKSGFDEDGRRVGEPCENIVVTNCTMIHGHGGVVIGSEMSGDVRNVSIANCVFDGTDRGLRIKTTRGRGGVVENIRASTIVMRGINYSAFTMSMRYDGDGPGPEPVTEETPELRNIHYENVTVTESDTAALIEGLAEMPVSDVSLSNVHVGSTDNGLDISYAEDVLLNNVTVDAGETPALEANRVTTLEVDRLRDPNPDPDTPVVRFESVDGALVQSCTASEGTGTFLELVGADNEDVRLSGNLLTKADRERVEVDEA